MGVDSASGQMQLQHQAPAVRPLHEASEPLTEDGRENGQLVKWPYPLRRPREYPIARPTLLVHARFGEMQELQSLPKPSADDSLVESSTKALCVST